MGKTEAIFGSLDERSEEFIPLGKRFFGGTKTHKEMEPYPPSSLPDDKLADVVEYLMSLMGDEAGHVDAARAERGKKLFDDDLDCNSCHEVKPGESGSGPNLSGSGTRAWIQRVLRDASADHLYGKSSGMPKFGKKLTDEEIRQLSDLIAAGRSGKTSG